MFIKGKYFQFPWIGCIALLFFTSSIHAQSTTPGVQFLRMSVGSRAQAMGEAYTAIAQNANGIYYNPAGMGFGMNRELMFFHSEWFENIAMENVTFFYPFTNQLSIGTGISYLHMPELTRYEIDPVTGGPLENGTFSVSNMVITTGIGFRLNEYVSIGTNLKFFQDRLESVTASGVAFDVGFLTRLPGHQWSLGFAIQHLGPSVKYIQAFEKLPLTYRGGIAYHFINIQGTIALDIVKTKGRNVQILPGFEFGFLNSFYLRGGYQMTEREGSGFTTGFGLKLPNNHKLNYVYVPYGDLGDTHRAELILSLGSPPIRKPSYTRVKETPKVTRKAQKMVNRQEEQTRPQPSVTPKTTEPRVTRQLTRLAPPADVRLIKVNDHKMKLTWRALPGSNIKYHIYAKPITSSKWIKITRQPISVNYQIFSPKKSGVVLQFVITAVRGEEESDFSKIVNYHSQ